MQDADVFFYKGEEFAFVEALRSIEAGGEDRASGKWRILE